jgi:hypothetical protein
MKLSPKKVRRIVWRATQIALLAGIFVLGGFFLPMRTAPTVFEYLPFTTPQEKQAQQWSVQITNRNADSGEQFLVAARNPTNSITITDISYSCAIDDVQLVYETDDGNKQLPCETEIVLPKQADHRLRVFTDRSDVAYLPITLTVTDGQTQRDMSLVLATARINTDGRSRVQDQAVITFDEL